MKLLIKQILLLCLLSFTSLASYSQDSIFDTSANQLFKSQDDEFAPVDDAFRFDFSSQGRKVTVNFSIMDGYYLYRKQIKVRSKNAIIKPLNLPEGLPHEDEFFGVQQIYKQQLSFDIIVDQADSNAEITVRYQGCAEKGLCYPPQTKTIPVDATTSSDAASVLAALQQPETGKPDANSRQNTVQTAPVSEQNRLAAMLQQGNIWLTLAAFFVGGLLLSFTPCVFPMYPILTGIIVGQGQQLTSKKAFSLSFAYVQGMAVTYTALGIVVALAGAQFQAMFQHPVLLIALSLLFIFLALSMFGFFNLALPASWQNTLNNLSNKQQGGTYLGVLSMGVISGLVASPCTTAPLTGALLYISQTGDVLLGAGALYALSLGMGLPLLLLGSSGGKLLPKAGAWMNVIKNLFGFLLLAVPVFLLQRLLPAAVTEALWLLLLLSTTMYFYVLNQHGNKGFWYGVRSLAIFLTLFWAATQSLQLLSPTTNMQQTTAAKAGSGFIKVSNLSELQQQVAIANNQGKSVMVDLYADWCIACKEFEHYTFNAPQVEQALANTLLLQIDLTDLGNSSNQEVMTHFHVLGLPTILFFNNEGLELSDQRVTGFMDAKAFSNHIKQILPHS